MGTLRRAFLPLVIALTLRASLVPAQPRPALLVSDGAWCWFGNPRATFKDGLCYFGYVRFSDGRMGLNTYDPLSGISSNLWLSRITERDDHNNPALLPLSDGRLLAIYQKHKSESKFYFRVSADANSRSATNWSPEWQWTNTTAEVTYANPYQLSSESGKIYNFLRNLNFNPTFVTSDASGTNWAAPQILIKTGTGNSRPYVQYCSDSKERIDFTYTEAHPGDIGMSSLYHAYYRAGGLYQSDGTFLKRLSNAPLLHDSGERGSLVYQYSTTPTNDPNDHIQYGRAWCWDVGYQSNGAPVTVFSVQRTNVMGSSWYGDRIYYYYARWAGRNWQKRFIAHAGRPLYDTQRDYAGGISLDPVRPDVVYLASNAAEPFNTGNISHVPLRANDRYEIYRGVTANGGLTFTWQLVTTNSAVDNLRPYVPRRNPYPVGVLWLGGTYTSYTACKTTIYGLFRTNVAPVRLVPDAARVSVSSAAASRP